MGIIPLSIPFVYPFAYAADLRIFRPPLPAGFAAGKAPILQRFPAIHAQACRAPFISPVYEPLQMPFARAALLPPGVEVIQAFPAHAASRFRVAFVTPDTFPLDAEDVIPDAIPCLFPLVGIIIPAFRHTVFPLFATSSLRRSSGNMTGYVYRVRTTAEIRILNSRHFLPTVHVPPAQRPQQATL
jgi:hypothetical protein